MCLGGCIIEMLVCVGVVSYSGVVILYKVSVMWCDRWLWVGRLFWCGCRWEWGKFSMLFLLLICCVLLLFCSLFGGV